MTASAVPLVEYNFSGSNWSQWDARYRDPSQVAAGLSATRIERPDQPGEFDIGHFIQPGVGSLTDRYLTSWRWYPSGKYYEFSVTVDGGTTLQLDSISFGGNTNLSSGNSMSLSIAYADNAAFSDAKTMGSFDIFNTPYSSPFPTFLASANPIVDGTGTYFFRIYNTSPTIQATISYGLYLDSIHLNGSLSTARVPEAASTVSLVGLALVGLALFRRRHGCRL